MPREGVSGRATHLNKGAERGQPLLGRSSSASGCHCTDATQRSGSSSASTVPSSATAVTTSPSATRATAWWWPEAISTVTVSELPPFPFL